MDYKTILVYLDESARRAERLRAAFGIAATMDGHVSALFAARRSFLPTYAYAEAGPAVLELERARVEQAAAEAERDFRAAAAAAPAVRSDWSVAEASIDPGAAVRCADLVIAGQPEPDDAAQKAFAGDLLLSAGRPVLFIPYVGRFDTLGQRVLLAWNGTREAARALADALPFLRRARAVNVVTFDASRAEGPRTDVALQLSRHGVKATLGRERVPDVEVGEQILSRAADLGADLIVMGAYGHSRVRERVLGGATRTLLESMTVPVLMSH